MKKISFTVNDISLVAEYIRVHYMRPNTIIFLKGDMGSGKTTLSSAIVSSLGYSFPCSSPTYSYYNEYCINENLVVRHFDLYRIKNYDQLSQLGLDELLMADEKTIIMVEWPDIIVQHVSNIHALIICITFYYIDEETRSITISAA
jgi:tRNA threonylcarbamoyladenosine biosynthesis protein TsaE